MSIRILVVVDVVVVVVVVVGVVVVVVVIGASVEAAFLVVSSCKDKHEHLHSGLEMYSDMSRNRDTTI